MKSICIKTNNTSILNYLQNELEHINLENIYYSQNEFKSYKNIIIHYTGTNIELFFTKVATLLSYLVIDICEKDILNRLIFSNYFYFDSFERNQVLNICTNILQKDDAFSFEQRQYKIFESFYSYISENNKIIFTGFINFRLKDYIDELSIIIDNAVNSFIIEREYSEFISILKIYVNSQNSKIDIVHLVYSASQTVILDEDNEIINTNEFLSNTKYLSDITFSENDFAFNTLLTLVPNKILIHLVDKAVDEFIETLQLVFENRVELLSL